MTTYLSNAIKNASTTWWTVGYLAASGCATYLSKNVLNSRDATINELFYSKATGSCDSSDKENSSSARVHWMHTSLLVGAGVQFSAALALTVYRLYCRTQQQTVQPLVPQVPPPADFSATNIEPIKTCIGPPPGFLLQPHQDSIEQQQKMYASRLSGHRNLREKEKALILFEEMKNKGIPFNHYHYTIMIDLHADLDDSQEAENYYRQMCLSGIQPTVATFGSLLKIACQNNDAQRLERIVTEMKQRGTEFSRIWSVPQKMGQR